MADDTELFATAGGAGHVAVLGSKPLQFLLGRPLANGYGSASTAAEVAAEWDGRGKVVIITGASTGLGLESAKALAARGAEVILAVRDPHRAQAALAAVRAAAGGAVATAPQPAPVHMDPGAATGKGAYTAAAPAQAGAAEVGAGTAAAAAVEPVAAAAAITTMALDLSSLASVRAFAEAFRASGRKLHVLMCNAGVMATQFELSDDGLELDFATNHLSHFLLTQLLLDNLVATAEAEGSEGRIVVLTSYAHVYAPKDMSNAARAFQPQQLSSSSGYHVARAYGCSKLANILFVRQLAQRLEAGPVVVAACHPGIIIDTNLTRHVCACWPGRKHVTRVLMAPLLRSVQQGAATQVYLATAPTGHVISGNYYKDCNLEVSSVASHSRALARHLWHISEQLCAPFMQETDAGQSTAIVTVNTPMEALNA